MTNWLRRHDMSPANAGISHLSLVFFLAFMLYPLGFVFSNAFFTDRGFFLGFLSGSCFQARTIR